MSHWYQGRLGRAVTTAEAQLLNGAMDDVFGLELMQLGVWGSGRELLRGSRTRHQSVVASTVLAQAGDADLIANPAHLPVATGSVDAVLLPHSLEIEPDPQAVLREADRVLTGQGHLVVLGFRPLSLWGLRAAASHSGFPPGLNRLISEQRLRDWLILLGYEITAARHYLYLLPCESGAPGRGALRRGLFNPLPAGAYLLKARKRVYTLTPIRARRRERAPLLGALVNPTT
ncbi:MAG: methyltransferase domain-containing protein [Steroidobacteraceae bacterium]